MELKYNNIDYLNESISVLPQEDREKLKSILSENFYKKGEIISNVKEIEEHIYIISRGGARVFYLKDGKEITFSFAFDQDLILYQFIFTTFKNKRHYNSTTHKSHPTQLQLFFGRKNHQFTMQKRPRKV